MEVTPGVTVHTLAGEVSVWTQGSLTASDFRLDTTAAALLAQFADAAASSPALRHAGAIASSLAAFGRHDTPLDEQSLPLARHLMQALATALSGQAAVTQERSRWVPLVAPSAPRDNRAVALYLDHSAQQHMLVEMLRQADFEPLICDNLDRLRDFQYGASPAAIMVDLSLCSLNPNAHRLLAEVCDTGELPPHLFCIGPADDTGLRLEAVRLGATRYFETPLDISRILAVLKGVTSQVRAMPFRVVLIDDDPLSGRVNTAVLEQQGIEVMHVMDPLQAWSRILQFEPDVVVSDVYMPGCNGLELLAVLRQNEQLVDTPIIFLSSDQDEACRLEATELGADDFLTKPVSARLLRAAVIARARRARALKRSRKDSKEMWRRLRELESRAQPVTGQTVAELENDLISLDDFSIVEPPRTR